MLDLPNDGVLGADAKIGDQRDGGDGAGYQEPPETETAASGIGLFVHHAPLTITALSGWCTIQIKARAVITPATRLVTPGRLSPNFKPEASINYPHPQSLQIYIFRGCGNNYAQPF